ncbi:MAG: hypothetical protein NNA25_00315 [Nitrospira sp.]|nr:hypothetical protein [Nitrospira sp.]
MELRNYDAAMALILSEKDLSRKQFMARALTAFVRKASETGSRCGELDILFFVQAISDLYEQKENLIRVLSGEDLSWWREENGIGEP